MKTRSNGKPIIFATRDVMNPKSDRICRHAVRIDDAREIRRWYALETRMYPATWSDESRGFVKTSRQYLVNEIVFDFDIPDALGDESQVEAFLECVKSILGQPKCIIRNKSREELDALGEEALLAWFGKNGTVHYPKMYGCQVVYDLSESVDSAYVERERFLNAIRLKVTEMVGADPNFRGHMFKNYHNSKIFNVQWNLDDHQPVNLEHLAEGLGMRQWWERAWALPKWYTFDGERLAFKRKASQLVRWYVDLNRYRGKWAGMVHGKLKEADMLDLAQRVTTGNHESRNVCLFNFLRSLSLEQLEFLEWSDLLQRQETFDAVFGNCDIQEPLSEAEFESTKRSVMNHRMSVGYDPMPYGRHIAEADGKTEQLADIRVFDVHLAAVEPESDVLASWVGEYCTYACKNGAMKTQIGHFEAFGHSFKHLEYRNVRSLSDVVLNALLYHAVQCGNCMEPLEQVANYLTKSGVEGAKQAVQCNCLGKLIDEDLNTLSLHEWMQAVKDALYAYHFTLVALRAEARKLNGPRCDCNAMRAMYRVPHAKSVNESQIKALVRSFGKTYALLQENGHLRENGKPLPVSHYQSAFKVRTADAGLYVAVIKMYLEGKRLSDRRRKLNQLAKQIQSAKRIQSEGFKIAVESVCNGKILHHGNALIDPNPKNMVTLNLITSLNIDDKMALVKRRFNHHPLQGEQSFASHCFIKSFRFHGKYVDISIPIYQSLHLQFESLHPPYLPDAISSALSFQWMELCFFKLINLKEGEISQGDPSLNGQLAETSLVYALNERRNCMFHFVYDTETTGFDPKKCPVIQLAAVFWDDEIDRTRVWQGYLDWNRLDGYRLNMGDSVKVHGITNEFLERSELADHPVKKLVELKRTISEFMGSCVADGSPSVKRIGAVVAQNLPFDINMTNASLAGLLKRYGEENADLDWRAGQVQDGEYIVTQDDLSALRVLQGTFSGVPESAKGNAVKPPLFIDTVTLDIMLHYEEDGVKLFHNLEDMGLRYGLGANEKAHDALYDTKRLFQIYRILIQELKEIEIKKGVAGAADKRVSDIVNQRLEDRIVRKWNHVKSRHGKEVTQDYFGRNVGALVV